MGLEQIFQLVNGLALLSWIFMMIFSYWQWTTKIILGIVITGLSILYVYLILSSFDADSFSNFSSLAGIKSLFANDQALLAGWIHYLAFDLLAGVVICNNAKSLNIPQLIIIPCLIFCFILGPMGLLLYLLIRVIFTRKLMPSLNY